MSARESRALLGLTAEAHGPLLALVAAVAEAQATGRPVPCSTNPDAWHADDRATRTEAATACTWCPARRPCGVYARSNGERWGVWAGVDHTEPRPKKRKP